MDELDRELQALMEQYAATLPERMAAIQSAYQAAVRAKWSVETARVLLHGVHRLGGSAAMCGYPDLSRAARPLEVLLGEICDNTAVPDASSAVEIDALMAALMDVYAHSKQHLEMDE